MTRRSTPQAKTDDLAFPVRVKFAVPGSGIRSIHDTLGDRMRDWLRRELAPGDYELGLIMEPMSRVLWRLTSLASVRVLEPVVEDIPVEGQIERVIAATWLHDIAPAKGKEALKRALLEYSGAPILRLLLASHFLWRVFWNHYKTAGAPHFVASVKRILAPIGMKPNPKRIEQATKGASST